MELRDLQKEEIITNKPKKTNNDFSEDALGPPVMKDYKKERSKKASAFQIFMFEKKKLFRDILKKMSKIQKFFYLICFFIVFINFIVKCIILYSISYSLLQNFSILKPFIFSLLEGRWYYLILYYINILFLFLKLNIVIDVSGIKPKQIKKNISSPIKIFIVCSNGFERKYILIIT